MWRRRRERIKLMKFVLEVSSRMLRYLFFGGQMISIIIFFDYGSIWEGDVELSIFKKKWNEILIRGAEYFI